MPPPSPAPVKLRGQPPSDRPVFEYSSMLVQLLAQALAELPAGQILDVGPVNGENINFFARRASKLFICDLFQMLHKTRRQGKSVKQIWQHLDYPPAIFHAVLLWDILDHLEDETAAHLVTMVHQMLKPGGLLAVLAQDDRPFQTTVDAFIVTQESTIRLRNQPHLQLSRRIRQNREILSLLGPFVAVESFIYRNGCREFLFRRD